MKARIVLSNKIWRMAAWLVLDDYIKRNEYEYEYEYEEKNSELNAKIKK